MPKLTPQQLKDQFHAVTNEENEAADYDGLMFRDDEPAELDAVNDAEERGDHIATVYGVYDDETNTETALILPGRPTLYPLGFVVMKKPLQEAVSLNTD